MEERCICCGEIIPEGRQVCPVCEAKADSAYLILEKEQGHDNSTTDKRCRHICGA